MSEAQRLQLSGSFHYSNGNINGVNSLRSSASRSAIDEFCYALGGNKPIRSILIANNGMAAVKFIRSVRTWSYETFGSEKAILLVAMATPEDMRINAEHIRIADQFVEVPGGTNNNNYANVQLIVETAEITHVDAVWPGWGHASEIPELPDALEAKGIVFLGPPASSMAALGDKIGSSLIAQAADVPTLPWSGSHVKIPAESCLVSIPDDAYRKACVYTTEEAIASCQVVGYPAMIKASWGGGGKGIRKVHNDEEVKALFKQVQGEVPGSPIFIMKVASQSRHLEVQLLCDQYGNVAALHSRDCSVQRRHQKIIEEGPITVAPPDTIKKLEQAARRLAKSVNYVGAATVEYLYSMETGDYYFLELNPRLQVEHPVTEWIAEINIPAAQVAVGMGIPLWQIPEIRRFYGMDNSGGYDAWRKTSVLATPFDFDQAQSIKPKGHCIAVRVTSEDPDDGFKPTSGKVQELSFKSKPNVWAYFSVKSGGGIHEFSDSQFGHVFAFGESRTLAIANMVLGLKEIQIRGEIRTNVDYTIDLLHAPDYRENKIHTGWLDSRIAMRVRAERPPWYLSVVGGALYKAAARSAAMVSDYIGYLEKGQIPPKHITLVNSQVALNIEGNKYTIDMVKRGPGSYRLRMNQSVIDAEIHTLRDGGLLMQLDGNSHIIYAEEEAAGTRLLIDGRTCLLQNDHDPSKLMAETPCKLLRYLVSDGSHVDADTPYAEVEVMKMCMPLLSPASGVIQFKMSEGQAMQSRHLEVQLLCDQYGNVAALHSRDCSVQRRHQKIIEEGPITVAPPDTIKKLEQAARRLAKSVNYVGAATVEYLYSMETGDYYFLELNPRLQVEHPVTEWIAEINIPAAQVAVGMGIPLWQIPEIRRFYGMDNSGGYDAWRKTSVLATPFDFDQAQSIKPKGHCIAVRVTSEDPDDGFKPTSGKVQELSFKSKPNVWAYFSVKSGGGIHEFSDSQFGHVFAFGESRTLAIANMVLGLKEIQIRGEIRTNVDYTIDLLHAPDYRENKIHTGWLDSRIAMRVRAERPPWYLSVVGGALYKAAARSAAMVSDYIGYLEKGQIPPKHITLVNSQVALNIEGNKYTIDMVKRGPGSYRLRMNQSVIDAEIHTLRDGGLLMQLDGNSHIIYAEEEAAGTRLLIDGRTCLLQAGELIARLDLDDPSAVRKAEPFDGSFPVLGPPTAMSDKVHQKCAATISAARMILAGYDENIDDVVQNLLHCLDSPELPFLQWQECFAVLANRLPKDLRNKLESKFKEYEGISIQQAIDFPAKVLRGILETHLGSCSEKEKVAQERLVEPLMSLVKSYEGGRESHARGIVHALFEEYLFVEELFSDNTQADVIERLRLQYKKDLLRVVDIVLSHQGVRSKNKLILRLMEHLVYPNPAAYREKLIRFSSLNHTNYSELALKASQLLEQTKLSELRSSIARSLSELDMFTEEGENIDTPKRKSAINERMEDIVSAPLAVEDALVGLFDHSDPTLQRRVVETYVRRLYQPYLVKGSVRMQWHRSGLIASWQFVEGHIGELTEMTETPLVDKKFGAMVITKSLQFLPDVISAALKETVPNLHVPSQNGSASHTNRGNMMHIALAGINNQMSLLQDSGDEDQAQERVKRLAKILKDKELSSSLKNAGYEVISCIIQRDEGRGPMRHSFHWSEDHHYYIEEPLLRHVEPPLSIYLELDKLKGYENIKYTPSRDRQWHMYTVEAKPLRVQRMFLRTLVRQATKEWFSPSGFQDSEVVGPRSQLSLSYTSRSILRSLVTAMEELELHVHNATVKSDHAHMYLYVLNKQQMDDLVPYSKRVDVDSGSEEGAVEALLVKLAREIHSMVGVKMHRLGVFEWEVKLCMTSSGQANGVWRVVVTNVTGHTCIVHVYREIEDNVEHKVVYQATSSPGPLHGVPVNTPFQPLKLLDQKRLIARKSNTTYCYDFALAFEAALENIWSSKLPGIDRPGGKLVNVTELVFADPRGSWGTPLVQTNREPGQNNVGMVAWTMDLHTPEFPQGRTILVVANDVTFRNGSFGPIEDAFFKAVTELACAKKLPLIYLAANSGARIGAAEEVRSCFRIGWADESGPDSGFQYLYLTPDDYNRIKSSVLAHELKLESGETRWVIDTIVGKEDGLGVENLSGSGAIAGAYSKAYTETFTLTYVTGRTVGIGAYLARLGMRCIQRLDQPIILTGFSALNKLLGREVYSSQMQLGGPKIMATNGVVHLTVSDDLEGVMAILNWLSFVPPYVGGPLPVLAPVDPVDRPVEYQPENSCDPRAAICGAVDGNGSWVGGIFDKDSFVETLEGWARTVVTGRAKLGGIPVGVIAVETQTVMQVIPADPGQLDSHERVVPQAGQVWFPDSASKTAQALMDFNREELPLFIMANWRGFSAGQRDLFEGILQAGSTIVENLRTYNQPVFVYIPKTGELRGGAWVVVDSRINSDHIEMYAETTAKGNVLEPEGMIEIKFRNKELLDCMNRLDPQLQTLRAKLQQSKFDQTITDQIKAREKQLLPIYTQIATKFAELHDTSFRMAEKGVVKHVVDWPISRFFFYKRLRRRLAEALLIGIARDAAGDVLSYNSAYDLVKEWFLSTNSEDLWLDDDEFFTWKDNPLNYSDKLAELRKQKVSNQLLKIGGSSSDLEALPQGIAALLQEVDPGTKSKLIEELRRVIN